MKEPGMDDWLALRRMIAQSIGDGIRSNLHIDAMAEDLQHVFNRWATDRDLNFAASIPGPQHYQPPKGD